MVFNSVRSSVAGLVVLATLISPVTKADTVLELFTSHSCYSCPPAEKLLSDIVAEDESVIALEFHVDYWNNLVYGDAGKWTDPFSKPAYSERQRNYDAKKLVGRRGVYTPQAVINGQFAAVGSNRSKVMSAIENDLPEEVVVSVQPKDAQWEVRVENSTSNPQAAESLVWMVRFIKSVTTEITAGENKGLTIENHNVVTSMEPIGVVPQADAVTFNAPIDPDPNIGCAIIVQDSFQSPIVTATKCPS